MLKKRQIYVSLIVLLLIVGAVFVITRIKEIEKPKKPETEQLKDCTGINDIYLHCMSLMAASDSFCQTEEWAVDTYELQKDRDFCLYFRKYKEAIIKKDREVCLEILDLDNFDSYDCSKDEFGCPDQPLNCYIALSEDASVCDELDRIIIKGFTQEEKKDYCNLVFELEKEERHYETDLFKNRNKDTQKIMTMIQSIRRKDPALCVHMDKHSRDFVACHIYSSLYTYGSGNIDQDFCDQFKECDPKEGMLQIED